MKQFVELFLAIDSTTLTNNKIDALTQYYESASNADAAWATAFLTGNKFKRFITSRDLQQWALEYTDLPDWLFKQSYASVGDTAETVALLVASSKKALRSIDPINTELSNISLHELIEQKILPLRTLDKSQQSEMVKALWQEVDSNWCFVFNKILTGAFRVGVAKATVYKALAKVSSIPTTVLAHRFTGKWQPSAAFFAEALDPEAKPSDNAKAYPFCLAYPLQAEFDTELNAKAYPSYLQTKLEAPSNWIAEWKWDGIRGQLLKHHSGVYLWSRGEDIISVQFPELIDAASALPEGAVLDGEILCWQDGKPQSFAHLQKRLGRKKPSAKTISRYPAIFMAYDLLEKDSTDIRERPLIQRRSYLEDIIARTDQPQHFLCSPLVAFDHWHQLEQQRLNARQYGVEGLMIKRKQSAYRVGRKKGDWWKYKLDPYTVDAVLLYAQPGSGRRANLYTDYTFAVWQDQELVPVAKAYSGLSDKEINRVDAWIRKNTVERFGPVRSVKPELVFELAFENIAPSSRHKSKLALRFPRIQRWREDKAVEAADNITLLQHLVDEKSQAELSVFDPTPQL